MNKSIPNIPKYAGYWQIGGWYGIRVPVGKKPKWITRWLCHKLLEWEWIDTTDSKL